MSIRFNRRAWVTALFLAVGLPTAAWAQTVQRPIQDFVSTQVTTTGWGEPATGNTMFVDYTNRTNTLFHLGLPTSFTGKVTEQALPDGRARVHVVLHTKNAYTTAFQGGVGFVFGSNVAEIIGGAQPGLADSTLTLDFINTAPGAPLPDLNTISAENWEKLSFVATAKGPLRALFGVAAGTPGMAHTTQQGLLGVDSNGAALADLFPAEKITIKQIGK